MAEQEEIHNLPEQTWGVNDAYSFAKILWIIGGLFPLALIIGSLQFILLFKVLKWRPNANSIVLAFESFVIFLSYFIIKPFSNIYLNDWHSYITPYIFLSFVFSIIISAILIFWYSYKFKHEPESKFQKGWLYEHKYKDSFIEFLLKKKLIKNMKSGKDYNKAYAPLGISVDDTIVDVTSSGEIVYDTKVRPVRTYYEEAFGARLLLGGTGAGKSQSMLQMVKNDITAGYPVCVVDFKKDPSWTYYLSKWAKEHNKRFYHFQNGKPGEYNNPFCDYQASYDPLATGSSTSLADMVLNLRSWDGGAEIYQLRTKDILQAVFFLLDIVDKEETKDFIPWDEGGLSQLLSALDTNNLTELVLSVSKKWVVLESEGKLSEGDRKKLDLLQKFITNINDPKDKDLRSQIENLISIIRSMMMSSYGDWLAKSSVTPYHINLTELCMDPEGPIVLFQFDPRQESDFTKYMGGIVLSDISRASAYKNQQRNNTPFGLYLDEFQSIDPKYVRDILEKARSSKFATVLSTQSLEHIVNSASKNGESVMRGILDTVKNVLIHAGASEHSAKVFAGIVGKAKIKHYHNSIETDSSLLKINFFNKRQNRVSSSLIDEYLISPKSFQELSYPGEHNNFCSTAYYITKSSSDPHFAKFSRPIARKLQVILDEELLGSVPIEWQKQYNTPKKINVKKNSNQKVELLEKNDKKRNPIRVDKPKQVPSNKKYNKETKNFSEEESTKNSSPKRKKRRTLKEARKPKNFNKPNKIDEVGIINAIRSNTNQAPIKEDLKKTIEKEKLQKELDDIFNI